MAFLAPHSPRQPIFHAPLVVLLLIGLLVGLHVARTLLPADQSMDMVNRFGFIPAHISSGFVSQHGITLLALSFLTYMALHGSYTHLAVNCLFLFAFAPIVAQRFGAALFLLFFTICGVLAALTYGALNWGSPDPVIGASGAISGLMAAGIRLLPTVRPSWAAQDGPPSAAPMLPLLSRQMLLFTLVWAVLNIVTGFTGSGMAGEVGLIAWQAHLGGYAAGLILSGPFDRLRPQPVGQQI